MELSDYATLINTDEATLKRALRHAAGTYRPVVIELVATDEAPHLTGEPGHHTTPSGKTIVRYPRAYGWRTVYHCSTERVTVGHNWMARNAKLVVGRLERKEARQRLASAGLIWCL